MLWSFIQKQITPWEFAVYLFQILLLLLIIPNLKVESKRTAINLSNWTFQRFVNGANLMSGNFPSWLLIVLVIQIACMFDNAIAINVYCHVLEVMQEAVQIFDITIFM